MLYGAIIGDIVGSAYEFNNTKDYYFQLFTPESDFTDDSIMTVAVAMWLIRDPEHTHRVLEELMVEYANRYPSPKGGYGMRFHRWLFGSEKRHPMNSWGNGSAMRVSAVGWAFSTLAETERVAEISASITHDHPEGIKGAQATAAAIWLARNGRTKAEIRSYIESRYGYNLHRSWAQLHPVYKWDSSCQGTVPEALIAFLDSTDFEDAIRKAVSLGGDSDTLACITGAVAEAFYEDIPEAMIRKAEHIARNFLEDFLPHFHNWVYHNLGIIPSASRARITPQNVDKLASDEVFVFGSNLEGAHMGGAARTAYQKFGAVWGKGVGMQGRSYAIPTMQGPVSTIKPYVDDFIEFAKTHPEEKFLVTRIGCGIAGFSDEDMAPLFEAAKKVPNIYLPESFRRILGIR